MKGMIFDIQRFSLHDGPGIRTTVFFKGCPLSCEWCHNPESLSPAAQLMYDPGRCLGCLRCAAVCGRGAHLGREENDLAKAVSGAFAGGTPAHALRFDRCAACGACVEQCPANALKIAGEEKDADEIMAVVLRDAVYYGKSGGGVTLSGGEPTMQPEFALELLRLARQSGIHTCVETCGFAAPGIIREFAALTDLFLYDCKAADPALHERLTGVSNGLILNNLALLYELGADVALRCPLVPGVNDSEKDLAGLAELAGQYPRLSGVEIMPYHAMGSGKAARLGLGTGQGAPIPTPGEELKGRWAERLRGMGCGKVRVN